MKYKIKFVFYFGALFLFCSFYRLIYEGKNANNLFYGITDFTVNTQGYLSYIHTATFYTLMLVFIFGSRIIRLIL